MIKQTVFSNLQVNGSFYIISFEEFFIKISDDQYVMMGKANDIIEVIHKELPIFCDDYQMKVKPIIPQVKKRIIF